jgi:hypothetical protein
LGTIEKLKKVTQEAGALTPLLFFGETLPFKHTYVYGDGSDLVRAGTTVRVDNDEWALITLLNLGVPMADAQSRLDRAKHGLQEPVTVPRWSEDG